MRIDDVINELNKIKRMEGNVEVKYEVDFEEYKLFPMNFEYDREKKCVVIAVEGI